MLILCSCMAKMIVTDHCSLPKDQSFNNTNRHHCNTGSVQHFEPGSKSDRHSTADKEPTVHAFKNDPTTITNLAFSTWMEGVDNYELWRVNINLRLDNSDVQKIQNPENRIQFCQILLNGTIENQCFYGVCSLPDITNFYKPNVLVDIDRHSHWKIEFSSEKHFL